MTRKLSLSIYAIALSAALLSGIVVFNSQIAQADTANITFESPTYAVGNINGQDGWTKTGAYDAAVTANTYGFASLGSQVLRISNAVTSGAFGDQTFSKSLVNEAGETVSTSGGMSGGTRQPHFEAQFDIASASTTQQSGLVLSVSPDRGDGSRMSYLRFVDDAAGVDVFFDDVSGTSSPVSFNETQVANNLSRGSVHTIKFVMDFVDGPSNDVVKIYIDGSLVHTGTSWENYYRYDAEASAEQTPRTTDDLIFRAGGTAAPATSGEGFLIDNVMLMSGPVPSAAPVTVTIVKMIDGTHASTTNATSSFPMSSTWSSTSTGSGSGTFSLGPTGFNNPSPYEATTADMTSGASYSTSETTSTSTGAVVGADCSTGAQYRLLGYSTGDSRGAAASSTISTTSPSFTNITTNKFVYVWNATCTPQAATTSTVTIVKYVDGSHATASSSNNATFPMQANYQASNVNGGNAGTDSYSIGPVGNNTANAYEAKTIALANGASYGTFEHTNTGVVGTACNGTTTPFRLVGYTWGDSLAGAASSSPSTTSPSFTNLQSNKFVIVWNATCGSTTTPPTATSTVKVHILKYLDGSKATAASSSSFMFPMTATWNASNLNGGATSTGQYVLGNNHGGAADQYGADTAAMDAGANYATNEITATSSGMVLPIGAACETNKYRLVGYKTSNISFADAAAQTVSTSSPNFWALNTDRYVIVLNETCNGSQNPPPVTTGCAASSTPAGYTRVNGTVGNDRVVLQPNTFYVGMGGNDRVVGGDGNYIICTGPGNDTITLGNGNAEINAGGGNNQIETGDGTHTIVTGSGNDTITTGAGADSISAGGGNNKIISGGSNDSVTTGSGNDKIDGGPGTNDSCAAGGGNNQVTNCES